MQVWVNKMYKSAFQCSLMQADVPKFFLLKIFQNKNLQIL